MFDTTRENRPQHFFYWKVCLFFKNFCFQQPLRSYKNAPINSTVIVRIPSGPFKSVPGGFFYSTTLESCSINFFHWINWLFFWKKLCSQQFHKCYRDDLITSTVIVRKPFGPLQFVPWGLSHSIKGEKQAKIFCHRKKSFFWKVWFSTFLGPKNWPFSGLHKTSQIIFWTLFKMFHDICHARYHEKK